MKWLTGFLNPRFAGFSWVEFVLGVASATLIIWVLSKIEK